MNKGAFYKEDNKILLLDFEENIIDVPFEMIENGMITKNSEGCYLITKVKEKTVNVNFFKIVQNGNVIENPFDFGSKALKNISDGGTHDFIPRQDVNCEEPLINEFEEKLIELGFFRTDKKNFKRELIMERNYKRNKIRK